MANIEKNLRELIKAKGLKLSDVADRMGTTVSNLLSSVKGNPTVSKLEDIAAALQVNVSELLTNRPESALGFVIIGGQTYQLSKPSKNTVQIPTYARYDDLRECFARSPRRSPGDVTGHIPDPLRDRLFL